MSFLSYTDWLQERYREADRDPGQMVRCPDCFGDGTVDCCECGAESDCEECDGTGRRSWGSIPESLQSRVFTHADYRAAVLHDAEALAAYSGRDVAEILLSAGFHPRTRVVRFGGRYRPHGRLEI